MRRELGSELEELGSSCVMCRGREGGERGGGERGRGEEEGRGGGESRGEGGRGEGRERGEGEREGEGKKRKRERERDKERERERGGWEGRGGRESACLCSLLHVFHYMHTATTSTILCCIPFL